ncbi:hypothetical protein [Pontivivens ytuae]|uniref:Uncharacterized protein n=1 Tax=Pontivivens ytuae TaxID=2789856 RepID=A0A7S9LT60_9RHOB|nr:hypothetical protein [Pontivivens ytuae]QPH54777.1 hypothetical protein I0K15_03090 [Pontivivens ytuae]
MMRLAVFLLLSCYVLIGLFVLSIAPTSLGAPFFLGCLAVGSAVVWRMTGRISAI